MGQQTTQAKEGYWVQDEHDHVNQACTKEITTYIAWEKTPSSWPVAHC